MAVHGGSGGGSARGGNGTNPDLEGRGRGNRGNPRKGRKLDLPKVVKEGGKNINWRGPTVSDFHTVER